MKLKIVYALTLSAVLSVSFVAWSGVATAQTADVPAGQDTAASASFDLVDGEIRKVDKEAGKLTIKHGPIKSLDMPSMTMVYPVRDAAMLDQVQTGDKVRFRADNHAGKFVVTEIQSVR
ncbi:copper-binding protein [Cupriavidus consociatus]|uniref:copper-binding protein n=1 Tax=Cupriavidus consociatus TaxID=2821357 RepID=UPI001AEB5E42|nr:MULTISPECIES: copper-binding protein [unclassified Cupriavidus]MBP0625090.1 copper-binding protein [Cupriavidus sp. LEh25]MDK2661829.1 copper-binding protein [Cupriavidus sp. LEh21]